MHVERLPVPKRPELGNLKCDAVTHWNEKNHHEEEQYAPPDLSPHLTYAAQIE